MFVGIDVSQTRGFDVCALDDARRVRLVARARDTDTLRVVLTGLPREAVVAVDAPPRPATGLVPGKDLRVAEQALHALGISVYPVPRSDGALPGWMREGFEVFRMLAELGFPLFLTGGAHNGVAIECYPHLTYVSLTGALRRKAPKSAWSRAALRGRVTGLPATADQDQLDAACAALTAWYFARGEWVGYGDPSEGVIIAPRTGHDLAGLRRAPQGQLSLPIEDTGRHARIAPPHASTFPERVLGVVAQIPPGKVATYGDVSRWAGRPGGARAVGTVVARHAFEIPAHRVVDSAGRPAAFPEDATARLRVEGVPFDGARVHLETARWAGPR